MKDLLKASVFLVLVSVLSSGTFAHAQAPARSVEELQARIRTGEKIEVTDSIGKKTQGKFDGISGSSLRLIVGDTRQEFLEARILEITKRRPESRWNGVLIGLGIGLIAGTINITSVCNNASERDDCFSVGWAIVLPIYAGAGAGSGALVDFAIKKHDLIFARGGTSSYRFGLSPIFRRQGKGIELSVVF